jgi:hypothetical protein
MFLVLPPKIFTQTVRDSVRPENGVYISRTLPYWQTGGIYLHTNYQANPNLPGSAENTGYYTTKPRIDDGSLDGILTLVCIYLVAAGFFFLAIIYGLFGRNEYTDNKKREELLGFSLAMTICLVLSTIVGLKLGLVAGGVTGALTSTIMAAGSFSYFRKKIKTDKKTIHKFFGPLLIAISFFPSIISGTGAGTFAKMGKSWDSQEVGVIWEYIAYYLAVGILAVILQKIVQSVQENRAIKGIAL